MQRIEWKRVVATAAAVAMWGGGCASTQALGPEDFVEASLADSWRIHLEDVAISESVQRGVSSKGYDRGRYAVAREGAMHLFHRNLAADLAGRDAWRA